MKKTIFIIFILILTSITVFFGFSNKNNNQPNTYYQVYLDGELLGNIKSQKKLEKYINATEEIIKQKYNVDEVFSPNGLEIKKIVSYTDDITSVEDIYTKIKNKKPFTIKGVQLTITSDTGNQKIYALDEKIYKTSMENAIKTFLGTEQYEAYINKTQKQLDSVGTYINSVYIENQMTIKDHYIPVDEKIFTSSEDLTKYLLFGTTEQQKKYTVKSGDTIEQVAFDNEISVEEFLISNPQFKNSNALLYPGLEITIGILDPQIKVTVEKDIVEDLVDSYRTIEEIDGNLTFGVTKVKQKGKDGLLRVKQLVKETNGLQVYVKPISKEQLTPSVPKIVVRGTKKIPGVGDGVWVWPTESGWRITSNYAYRIHPIKGTREFHGALDIAGTGHGSDIYAANNGVIHSRGYNKSLGNYIVINHNNGYYTQYLHLSKFGKFKVGDTVEKGQIIGYMGMTGTATGPHLHYAVWYGGPPYVGSHVNPWGVHQN